MKKIAIVLFLMLSSVNLVACNSQSHKQMDHSKTKNETKKDTQNVASKSSTENGNSSASSDKQDDMSVPSTTIKTSEAQKSDLGQARMALYQAGINSSSFSDDAIIRYWKESQDKKIDFVTYFKQETEDKK